jgi:hypothetical protein
MADKHAEVSETIAADATVLYDLIADLPRMGRWSPEATGGSWSRGATGPSVGARFRGHNKSGWRRWSTSAEVTSADPGKRFAFHVSVGGVPVADWSYDLTADGETTIVVERWRDCRPGWMDALSGPMMGVSDRASHNRRNMELTLTALKQAAEQDR